MARAGHLDQDQAERIPSCCATVSPVRLRDLDLLQVAYQETGPVPPALPSQSSPCQLEGTCAMFHGPQQGPHGPHGPHGPQQEILRWAELTGIETMLNQAQLHWSGHVTRMDDSRLPKQLFQAELSTGKRHKGGQRKRYKDVLKSTLKACNIPVDEWQALAQDRPAWRAATRKGTMHFERSGLQSLDDKRSAKEEQSAKP